MAQPDPAAAAEPTPPDRPQLTSFAPATGQRVGDAPVFTAQQVRDAARRGARAQQAWAMLPVEERCERLRRWRDVLVDRAEELVDVLALETGKPRQEALLHEVLVLTDLLTWYLDHAPQILAPRELELHLLKHRRSIVQYVPRGVVGIISPWNFPLVIPFGDVAAAVISGSAAVVKPSELTPCIARRVKELWDTTGLPEDLLQVVTGYGETGRALIDSGIDKLVFTGGVETGRKVAAACGERLIPCVMELGGKAPLIVCEDADIERAARAVVFGGFIHSGQACIAVERVYAHQQVVDALLERCVELTRQLRQGDGMQHVVDVGAMTFSPQMDCTEELIADALSQGATLKTGGHRISGAGQFFEPTILSDCTQQMRVMREEIFGPVVPFMRVQSDAEALRLANDSPLGLNAYIFSTDRQRATQLADSLQAGSVIINDVVSNYACPEAPFGGIKQSGFGRVHGADALRDMCYQRHVSADRVQPPRRDPVWFPYSPKTYRWGLKALRAFYSDKGVLRRLRELL